MVNKFATIKLQVAELNQNIRQSSLGTSHSAQVRRLRSISNLVLVSRLLMITWPSNEKLKVEKQLLQSVGQPIGNSDSFLPTNKLNHDTTFQQFRQKVI